MISFCNTFDIFGTTFSFTTLRQSKFHTNLGYFLSLTCFALVGAFIGVFGTDLFYKINPRIISEQVRPLNHTKKNFNTSRFTFAWRIEDDNSDAWNFTNKLYPQVRYLVYEKDPITKILTKTKKIYFTPETCTDDNIQDPSFKVGRNISQLKCIDFQKYNLTMGGFWDGDFVIKIEIKIFHCDGDDYKKNCSNLSDLKRYFIEENKLYFSIFYPEFFFEPNNLESPLRYQYVNYYNQISVNLLKKDRIFFKEVELEDDQNLLITEIKKDNIFAADKLGQDYVLKFDSDFTSVVSSEVYSIVLYLSKGGDKFTRKFMKLQELAATVGGFMQLIFVFGKILSSQYNSYQRNITLFNQLFDFDDSSQNLNDILKFNTPSQIPMISTTSGIIKPSPSLFKSTENKNIEEAFNKPNDINKESNSNIEIIEYKKKANNLSPEIISIANKGNLLKQLTVADNRSMKDMLPSYSKEKENELIKKLNCEDEKVKESKKFTMPCPLFCKNLLCKKKSMFSEKELKKINAYEFALNFIKEE